MDYREIDRLKKSPDAFRSIAQFLLRLSDAAWTEWELDFLESVTQRELDPGPSTRQCEVLLDLRDCVTFHSKIAGFDVRTMIDRTWQARCDLGEEDEQFVEALHASGASAIRRRALRRLLGCARQVDVIQSPLRL